MAVVSSTYWQLKPSSFPQNPSFKIPTKQSKRIAFFPSSSPSIAKRVSFANFSGKEKDPIPSIQEEEEDDKSLGVKAALSMLKFYKREISPLMPNSCRYVPTCSEYSMEAYKRYGVLKGTILTGWRLCRCNPLGGSGFDPPRWFALIPSRFSSTHCFPSFISDISDISDIEPSTQHIPANMQLPQVGIAIGPPTKALQLANGKCIKKIPTVLRKSNLMQVWLEMGSTNDSSFPKFPP